MSDEFKEIIDIQLVKTCSAFPEQYDAYIGDDREKPVGYLRLRHGYFCVVCPWVRGDLVYESEPDGDGIFEDYEREPNLNAAKEAIYNWVRANTQKA